VGSGVRTDVNHPCGSRWPIGALLGHSPAEPHEHRFSDWTTLFPTFGVPPEHPEIAEQVQRIRVLEKDPHAISLFEQAMRNDRERAQRLLRTIIAPGSASANDVIRKLDGDAPWPEKWPRSTRPWPHGVEPGHAEAPASPARRRAAARCRSCCRSLRRC
jgi:hypothetical protein